MEMSSYVQCTTRKRSTTFTWRWTSCGSGLLAISTSTSVTISTRYYIVSRSRLMTRSPTIPHQTPPHPSVKATRLFLHLKYLQHQRVSERFHTRWPCSRNQRRSWVRRVGRHSEFFENEQTPACLERRKSISPNNRLSGGKFSKNASLAGWNKTKVLTSYPLHLRDAHHKIDAEAEKMEKLTHILHQCSIAILGIFVVQVGYCSLHNYSIERACYIIAAFMQRRIVISSHRTWPKILHSSDGRDMVYTLYSVWIIIVKNDQQQAVSCVGGFRNWGHNRENWGTEEMGPETEAKDHGCAHWSTCGLRAVCPM